jgi:predicted nucleic acid-binding protein
VAVIVDSSVWIDALNGRTVVQIEAAMASGTLVLSPVVIAELLSGETTPAQRETIGELLQEVSAGPNPARALVRYRRAATSPPRERDQRHHSDAHLAQAALEVDATLLTRDEIFTRIAQHTPLRLAQLR